MTLSRMREKVPSEESSAEDRSLLDAALAGRHLGAILIAHALHLDEATLGMHLEAGCSDINHLPEREAAHLAEGAGGALGAVEEIKLPPAIACPGAGRGVTAADEIIEGIDMPRPIDPGLGIPHPTLIAGLGLILKHGTILALAHELRRLEECFHAQGEDLVEIEIGRA